MANIPPCKTNDRVHAKAVIELKAIAHNLMYPARLKHWGVVPA